MSYKKLFLLLCLGIFLSYGRSANAQSQTFNASGSGQSGLIQHFTVPACATSITVVASGAQGGANGGLGAKIQGTFTCTPGVVLNILVGQAGGSNDNLHGSGGGGSFITIASNDTILVIAGGGGGHGASGIDATSNGGATRLGQSGVGSGTPASGGGGGAAASGATGGVGCNNGSPAGGSTWAGGGGGFCGNGGMYNSGSSYGGYSYNSGGLGGTPATGANAFGGFGGGSGAGDRGGGGGGYSGGAGGTNNALGGGGGGSYNAGTNQINTAGGAAAGNGVVIIYWNSTQVNSASGNVISNIVCGGSNTGKASLLVNNVAGPSNLTYTWSPNVTTRDTATGLSAGTYTITVSGCGSASAAVTITQPAVMVVNAFSTANVSCNGQSNGSANSAIVGGTQPYIYSWTPSGGNAAAANGLSAGTYTLSVVDNHGCTGSSSVIITQPQALSVTMGAPTNEPCFGQSVGKVAAAANGGTQPYNYSWTNGNTTNSATGLSAGNYTLTVTDLHGCTVSAAATITQPAHLAVGAGTVLNNLCYDVNIGTVVAYVAGGPTPYTYAWTPSGGNGDTAKGMSIGTYSVLVTDASGCTGTSSATITQPTQVKVGVNQVPDDGACSGAAWLTVAGGISPYTYLWTNGNSTYMITNQCMGNYCCTVTDGNGCIVNTCLNITTDAGVGTVTSGGGKIRVYPNPTNGAFTVNVSGVSGSASIEVYDVLGAKVYSAALDMTQGGNTTVNMANQPNGIYLYRIISKQDGSMLGEGKIALEK